MANIVSFYNIKGGQGKTTLAINYALFSKSIYYTNDYKNGTELLFKDLFKNNDFRIIKPFDESIDYEDDDSIVFDFGGFFDNKVPAVIKHSELCIVPIMYQSQADLQSFFIGLEVISKINNNILVVINNTNYNLIKELKEGLEQNINYPIKIVKRSNYMTYLANDKLTPFQISGTLGATQKPLTILQNQLIDLFNFIKEF